MIEPIPKKKKCKKEKWLSEEALQIDEERRKTKGNGEKERYSYLNAVFLKRFFFLNILNSKERLNKSLKKDKRKPS